MPALLTLLSVLIVAFGQPAWFSWLAPLSAICGYALFWHVACKIPASKKRFFFALGWFALVQLVQLSWMTSIEYQGIYILFVYGFLAVGLGAQFGLLTLLVDRIPFVASASLWALMEWLRIYVLCGLSFNPIGLSLASSIFSLQAVTYFGIFGLSFWVILTNLAVWKKRWKAAFALAAAPYLIGAIQWNVYESKVKEGPCLSVALVQTALLPSQKMYFPERAADFISPYNQWERITRLLSGIEKHVDLVVLPESAIPYTDEYPLYSKDAVIKILKNSFQKTYLEEQDHLNKVSNLYWIRALGKLLNSDVIAGLDGEAGEIQYSSAFFASQDAMHRYDKQILLPLAEYLPFESLINLTKSYGITQFFTHGTESRIFHSKVPISTSICYEETFGHMMRKGRKEGAGLFVNVTNDNWYPSSRLPKQHFDLARVQSVANGLPLVRACNSGITSALDSLGQIVGQLEDWNKPDVLVADVPLYQISTLYTFWGDNGIVIISIILLTISVIINRKSLFVNKQRSH
ncbi:MAG: apolipoprotein N-acyltransferase [Rhabdochlamydiaceae bacterium]